MSLYTITEEIRALNEIYLSMINEETGEFIGDISQLEIYEKELKEMLTNKSEGIIKFIKNLEADIKSKKEEEKRLKESRQRDEKKLIWMKGYILNNMNKIGEKSVKTSLGTLYIRKSTQTVVDEKVIPKDERYWKQEITDTYDKNVIKELIKAGEQIEGVTLVNNENISIK